MRSPGNTHCQIHSRPAEGRSLLAAVALDTAAPAAVRLEAAQKLRPNDSEVLNLLGLVYFKTNAFPEAEVIYRRLAYPYEETIRKIYAVPDLDNQLGDRLRTGR